MLSWPGAMHGAEPLLVHSDGPGGRDWSSMHPSADLQEEQGGLDHPRDSEHPRPSLYTPQPPCEHAQWGKPPGRCYSPICCAHTGCISNHPALAETWRSFLLLSYPLCSHTSAGEPMAGEPMAGPLNIPCQQAFLFLPSTHAHSSFLHTHSLV